jgi:hypothetical protein
MVRKFLLLPALLLAAAALIAGQAAAVQPQDPAKSAAPGGFFIGADPAPAGTVPWQLLQSTKTVQKADKKFGPAFPKEVKELDKQEVRLYGFMMPLDQAKKQKRFLLSAFPPHCSFCLTGGPESLVEVLADKPIDFTFEPIVIAGRMAVLDNDVVYYRLTNATPVKP